MGQVLSALQGALTTPDGLKKACFFIKIPRENILNQIPWVSPLQGGAVGQFCFKFRCQIEFHTIAFFIQAYNLTILRSNSRDAQIRLCQPPLRMHLSDFERQVANMWHFCPFATLIDGRKA